MKRPVYISPAGTKRSAVQVVSSQECVGLGNPAIPFSKDSNREHPVHTSGP
jgi:hypothetical protein